MSKFFIIANVEKPEKGLNTINPFMTSFKNSITPDDFGINIRLV